MSETSSTTPAKRLLGPRIVVLVGLLIIICFGSDIMQRHNSTENYQYAAAELVTAEVTSEAETLKSGVAFVHQVQIELPSGEILPLKLPSMSDDSLPAKGSELNVWTAQVPKKDAWSPAAWGSLEYDNKSTLTYSAEEFTIIKESPSHGAFFAGIAVLLMIAWFLQRVYVVSMHFENKQLAGRHSNTPPPLVGTQKLVFWLIPVTTFAVITLCFYSFQLEGLGAGLLPTHLVSALAPSFAALVALLVRGAYLIQASTDGECKSPSENILEQVRADNRIVTAEKKLAKREAQLTK